MDRAFKALASTPRRRILNHLAGGPMTVGEIAAKFEMAMPSISKHLSILHEAGLVHQQKRGQHIPNWVLAMASLNRKTLVVCKTCHRAIHSGQNTHPFKGRQP